MDLPRTKFKHPTLAFRAFTVSGSSLLLQPYLPQSIEPSVTTRSTPCPSDIFSEFLPHFCRKTSTCFWFPSFLDLFKTQLFQEALQLLFLWIPMVLILFTAYLLVLALFSFYVCLTVPEKMDSSLKAGNKSRTWSVFSLYIVYIVLDNIFHKYEYHVVIIFRF